MKHKSLYLRNAVFLLIVVALFSTTLMGQKKPAAIVEDFNLEKLCGNKIPAGLEDFCSFYAEYKGAMTAGDFDNATFYRKELVVEMLRLIDKYYEQHTAKKTKDRAILQTIFDVLEIGASVAIGITNGERAKEVIGQALTGFQAGRNSLNNNFDLLKTKILINKMREDRAKIETEIFLGLEKGIKVYTWTDAKRKLQEYFYTGTFSHALNSLVGDTGANADKAEATLKVVKGNFSPELTQADLDAARTANDTLDRLGKQFDADATKVAALATLKEILTELKKDEQLDKLITAKNLATSNDGKAIIQGLKDIRREVTILIKPDLARKINIAISKIGNQ